MWCFRPRLIHFQQEVVVSAVRSPWLVGILDLRAQSWKQMRKHVVADGSWSLDGAPKAEHFSGPLGFLQYLAVRYNFDPPNAASASCNACACGCSAGCSVECPKVVSVLKLPRPAQRHLATRASRTCLGARDSKRLRGIAKATSSEVMLMLLQSMLTMTRISRPQVASRIARVQATVAPKLWPHRIKSLPCPERRMADVSRAHGLPARNDSSTGATLQTVVSKSSIELLNSLATTRKPPWSIMRGSSVCALARLVQEGPDWRQTECW